MKKILFLLVITLLFSCKEKSVDKNTAADAVEKKPTVLSTEIKEDEPELPAEPEPEIGELFTLQAVDGAGENWPLTVTILEHHDIGGSQYSYRVKVNNQDFTGNVELNFNKPWIPHGISSIRLYGFQWAQNPPEIKKPVWEITGINRYMEMKNRGNETNPFIIIPNAPEYLRFNFIISNVSALEGETSGYLGIFKLKNQLYEQGVYEAPAGDSREPVGHLFSDIEVSGQAFMNCKDEAAGRIIRWIKIQNLDTPWETAWIQETQLMMIQDPEGYSPAPDGP